MDVVVSDAHAGLVSARERCFQGAIWQRCQVHFRRNVVDRAPKSCHDELHGGLNRILKAEGGPGRSPLGLHGPVRGAGRIDAALETLEAGLEDAIAMLALPDKYRMRLRTTNMLERLIEEARRRERVIWIFPDERSPWLLLGALLAEQHELWITGRRWLATDDYWAWKEKRETEDRIAPPEPAHPQPAKGKLHNFPDLIRRKHPARAVVKVVVGEE